MAASPQDNPTRNPYPEVDAFDRVTGWKYLDETGCPSEKTFPNQQAALKELMAYIKWLNHGPNLWQRIWWPVRYTFIPLLVRFWKDQGHAAKKHPPTTVNQQGARASGDIVGRDKIEL